MRIVWATDIHLDHLQLPAIQKFCREIQENYPDAVVLTGDLSNAKMLRHHLMVLEKELDPVPVFFVCGNHDYYHGSISYLREYFTKTYTYPEYEKGGMYKGAYWLGSSGVIPLSDSVALIGHDGWYDGGYADYFKSRLDMNDYYLISELSVFKGSPMRETRYETIRGLARESAEYVRTHIDKAFTKGFKTVYVATHVPPFRENSTYNGKMSDDDWMPHFSSKIMGDMLLEVMGNHSDKSAIVLCGHSHGEACYNPLSNLEVYTGRAEYGHPEVCKVFNL